MDVTLTLILKSLFLSLVDTYQGNPQIVDPKGLNGNMLCLHIDSATQENAGQMIIYAPKEKQEESAAERLIKSSDIWKRT